MHVTSPQYAFTTSSQSTLSGAGRQPAEIGGSRSAGEDRHVSLFGLAIHDTTIASAADWLVKRALIGQSATVGFLNAHCVNVMYRNSAYRAALGNLDRIYADGSGVRIAAKSSGISLKDNVNGTDLFPALCQSAALSGVPLFLLGGKAGIAAAAGDRMCDATSGLIIAGAAPAYFNTKADEQAAIDAINASGAKIVLVGMGVPLQELWITRNRHRLNAVVVIGVGGLFDYYSGRIPRAPKLLRAQGLEWIWRLAMEPRRLAQRYILGNAEFLMRLAVLRLTAPGLFSDESFAK